MKVERKLGHNEFVEVDINDPIIVNFLQLIWKHDSMAQVCITFYQSQSVTYRNIPLAKIAQSA